MNNSTGMQEWKYVQHNAPQNVTKNASDMYS